MKFFIVFAIVCASISLSEQAVPKEQRIEMFKKLANECAAKEGATAADLDEAFAQKLPSTPSGKCLHACLSEAMGIMKDNKANPEGGIALAKTLFGDDATKMKVATEMAGECGGVADANRCELGFKILECSDKAAKARGYNSFADM